MRYQICMFPGQGSQHVGMGADLFPLFPDLTAQANKILGYDLPELCRDNPDNLLQRTDYTQPALFVVNALSYLRHVRDHGVPDLVLGHSLGETNALHAVGVFDFETALRIVRTRGAIMAGIKDGGMAAVIGLSLKEVREIVADHCPDLDVANINTRQQIVVSGPAAAIEAAAPIFEDAFASYIPLNVSGAFHSRYMAPAREAFARSLEGYRFQAPQIPVVSNVSARPYGSDDMPGLLVRQLTSPVRWSDSLEYVLGLGDCDLFETGPGHVLGNMADKIRGAMVG
jgi:trans-AT polyketide synthase/acyltransferase/oxidoreductase domain-containing protein